MKEKILDEIDELGLGQLKNVDIFEGGAESDTQNERNAARAHKEEKTEKDFIFKKTYSCPVCGTTFKAFKVKSAKPRLLSTDPDMRPVYQYLDVNKYDCVACEHCGYAALSKYFDEISDLQIRLIKEGISSRFKGIKPAEETYTYDEAIIRYQLALANTVVKKSRVSERAYLCLKLAWLYRGKRNELVAPDESKKRALYNSEMQYIRKAYEGFKTAQMNEMFPIAGMDEWTFTFLMAELSIECNDLQDAKKLISNIILSQSAPSRVKEKARDLKDYLSDMEEE